MIVRGIHLPEGDAHFPAQIEGNPLYRGEGTYQWTKLDAAIEVCGMRRGHAVDVGAHVGLWSRVLSWEFQRLTAFEPIAEYADCFDKNLQSRRNVTLHRMALGNSNGEAAFDLPPDKVKTASIKPDGQRSLSVRMLDDIIDEGGTINGMDFPPIDFLKLDCEGYELPVLQGGEQRIRRDKPVVIVEQKSARTDAYGLPRQGAVALLTSWGAELVWSKKGNYCLVWRV